MDVYYDESRGFWEYPNPWYKPEYKQRWVKFKEGGMHPTFISYNKPINYKGYYIVERVISMVLDACVCDVLDPQGYVITQRVTVRSCKSYIDSL